MQINCSITLREFVVIQLHDQEIKQIKEILLKYVPNCQVWVFGSRSKNTAKKYSDLDLLLKHSSDIPLKILSLLSEEFDKSELPFKVDLVDWHRITPEFQTHIKTHWNPFLNV
jgi:predicted nucleotidyltransferase